ncbi:ShlB/FhaC/HecB family hemolysin secretion/activation protein [Xylophilus rhododendri]|uniref:ShlB/FhaC/HecB family hemolysin secretion/activation protein n=1 Tax=Xylophilus rhododendri TaxID=2697032 RepID=A0A857J056_9BURK|nr:ShlB/FhaC/HecB family hemolysin secretion/activation protein [Xylophilus rhododendri]QHI97240.1 ShlB/FhaC/HecB family hemolysin secretion/activation protein [Xylophilus rhododendri]
MFHEWKSSGSASSLVGAAAVLWVCAAAAQPAGPATQQLLRQQERERQLRGVQESSREVPGARPQAPPVQTLPASETPCQPVHDIRLDGPMAGRFAWLPATAAGAGQDDSPLGRCLGDTGLQIVLSRMQQALLARGFVTTRVLAGAQSLVDGRLHVTLVPGVVHAVRPTPDSSPRLQTWNALPLRPGDLLQLRDIEQGLENLQRIPTVEADIQVEPYEGADTRPGQSDLLVSYRQALPLRLNLALDDGGTRATGRQQAGATLSYDNALTLNDLFYLSLGHNLGKRSESDERGTRSAIVHYSLPWGYWLFGGTASHNHYFQSVAGASQTYRYSGSSDNLEMRASRLLWRDAARRTTASLRGFRRSANNFIDDTEIDVQHRVTAGWEASLAHREYIGDAVLDASLGWRRGTGAFGAQAAPEEAFGEGSSRLKLLIGDLAYTQPFALAGQSLRYGGSWHGQWNRTPLTPQDRLALGGRYSVRGFDGESALVAERGWFWRNDIALKYAEAQEAYLGLDTGRVGGPSAELLLGRSLTGGVLGLRGARGAWSYDLFLGRPLHKPEGFRTARVAAGFNLSLAF